MSEVMRMPRSGVAGALILIGIEMSVVVTAMSAALPE